MGHFAQAIAKEPGRTAVFAFFAARMVERDELPYRLAFDRVVRAAVDAGLPESSARLRAFHGFAAAAAGHPEPPPGLEEGGAL